MTLDDLKNQYCNRNCIGCSASSLATAKFLVLNVYLVLETRFIP